MAFLSGESHSSSTKFTIGLRVLVKAQTEFHVAEDYSGAIVFAAMAVDAELARLYRKWRRIDALRQGTPPDDDS